MINEATRTIEDSQTAQALHGLLSLKSPETSVCNNFPALLKAVGQHIKPADSSSLERKPQQIIQMPDGMIYEVSEVPSPLTTFMLPSTKVEKPTDDKAPVVVGQIRPQQGQGSGSMVKLLLQMQSQADAAASAKKSATAPSCAETSQSPLTIAAAIPSPLTISPGQVLGQLAHTPKLGRPLAKGISPSSGNHPIILQHSKSANSGIPVPIQLLGMTTSSPMVHIVPQTADVRLTSTSIRSQLNGQPLIVPSLVSTTTSTELLTSSVKPEKQSPSRKRPQSVISHTTTTVNAIITQPLKIQKTYDAPAISRTVMTTLQARSSVLPNKPNSCTLSKPSSELAAVILPMLEPIRTDAPSGSLELPDVETLTAAIHKGFQEIFEHIQSQLEELRRRNNGADIDGADKTRPLINRVIAEQINTPVKDTSSSSEQVNYKV